MNKKYPLIIGAFLLTVASTYAATTTFNDEASFASWYKDAVKQMQAEGVITGYADGSFKPDQAVTRGELSLMLQRYDANVVDKKIATMPENSGAMTEEMVDKKIKSYFDEHENDYFDGYIQDVIDNTLFYADKDYDFKTELIMALSDLKELATAPDLNKLKLTKEMDAKLPEGFEVFVGPKGYVPPDIYLHFKADICEGDICGIEKDQWYGPF